MIGTAGLTILAMVGRGRHTMALMSAVDAFWRATSPVFDGGGIDASGRRRGQRTSVIML
jgi:hypothetical protein